MADQRIVGVPTHSHAGRHNYGFRIDNADQWYVIPQDGVGTGGAVQAMKIEFAMDRMQTIEFLADDANIVTFHGGAQGWMAHDID
jgi:hypothetical protein